MRLQGRSVDLRAERKEAGPGGHRYFMGMLQDEGTLLESRRSGRNILAGGLQAASLEDMATTNAFAALESVVVEDTRDI